MKYLNWLKLIAAIALCQAVGVFGSLFTLAAIPVWYATLVKPWFNPPGWIFGPVWTILYALMGISFYLVWEKGIKKKNVRGAVDLFLLQLELNAAWAMIFFGFHSLLLAFVEVVVLWLLVVETTFAFYRLNHWAGKLMLPYLVWVSFASVLNYSIWRLNG